MYIAKKNKLQARRPQGDRDAILTRIEGLSRDSKIAPALNYRRSAGNGSTAGRSTLPSFRLSFARRRKILWRAWTKTSDTNGAKPNCLCPPKFFHWQNVLAGDNGAILGESIPVPALSSRVLGGGMQEISKASIAAVAPQRLLHSGLGAGVTLASAAIDNTHSVGFHGFLSIELPHRGVWIHLLSRGAIDFPLRRRAGGRRLNQQPEVSLNKPPLAENITAP